MYNFKKTTVKFLVSIVSLFCVIGIAIAQEEDPKRVLITNVNVWDGTSDSLSMNSVNSLPGSVKY